MSAISINQRGLSETVQQVGDSMAISHELSGEIATALFAARERSPRELHDLKEIVFKIHSALEKLTDGTRAARRAQVDRHTTELPKAFQAGKP